MLILALLLFVTLFAIGYVSDDPVAAALAGSARAVVESTPDLLVAAALFGVALWLT